MPRKVFFSFHFERDAWRVGQVRNSNVVTGYDKPPFLDAAAWEGIRKQGNGAIKNWIDEQLHGTSVTVVLIGNQTSQREWVHYEIEESWKRGNGLLGISIHGLQNHAGHTDWAGNNPFSGIGVNYAGFTINLKDWVRCYDWIRDDGRNNMGSWIEAAAKQRGK